MKTWIGTSGFQYPGWRGGFYPADLSAKKMLPFYAAHFPTTEINYSFRRVPAASTLAAWDAVTPAEFRFSFKAPQKITHFAKLRNCGETVAFFHGAVTLLGPRLGITLFQLPPGFARDLPRLQGFLDELPAGLRSAFEFRHASWFADDVFAALQAKNAALCVAESADLATPTVVTADFGYLRLRREDYAGADVARWAAWLDRQPWGEAFVYFKHEETGVGPRFAAQLLEIRRET